MKYLLTSGNKAPYGNIAGEDCIYNHHTSVRVDRYAGGKKFRIIGSNSILLDFGNKRYEAYRAYRVITDEKLNYQCFVGRPNASFKYWKR